MNQPSDLNFYQRLPVMDHFFGASDAARYHPLPDDWFIAVTDIVNSTDAIENEQYKSVNIIGASSIAGILNIVNQDTIPFVFGGDGATIAIPPDLYNSAQNVLASCRKIAGDAYGLDLRAALVPVSYIYEQDKEINVAKFRVSDHYTQALFTGNGVRFVEEVLKRTGDNRYLVKVLDDESSLASFSGLECRWKEVSIPNKEVVTLLVSKNPATAEDDPIYSEALQKLQDIYGFDNATNPIATDSLRMYASWSKLMAETKLRTFGKNNWQRIKYLLIIQLKVMLGKIFMRFGYKSSQTDRSRYKTDMVINSDHRKFDDMLRIVISGSREQRLKMQSFLENKFEQARLGYGMHITNAAVITCMVFRYQHEHIHFVDGSNGGYVMASQQLKERMLTLAKN
jgi:hypothetical protein